MPLKLFPQPFLVWDAVARGDEDDEDDEVDVSVARAMEKPEDMDALSLAQYVRDLEEAGTPQVCPEPSSPPLAPSRPSIVPRYVLIVLAS